MELCIVDSGMKWWGKVRRGTVSRATNHDFSLEKWPMDGDIHGFEGLDW